MVSTEPRTLPYFVVLVTYSREKPLNIPITQKRKTLRFLSKVETTTISPEVNDNVNLIFDDVSEEELRTIM